ncbi:ketose-bisphosphate aldolase [Paenibacillus sp. LC231]|uniref:class II fructose-bisphosphate aldolase n=1 Tax=unclassified Paenibacillus TaxID=185978 RepID=UPI0008DE66EA|nr:MULTISPECIES: class II fructose-bisphosphate aldolase [unclassified Paenibacillus]MCT1398708.1 class II fructose-bisphosphate aldolase [Paenibacillus sp. p3-SID867]OIB02723.1 ketose-bisphosphate aldolase [Paenibacillus sp. LC231]
MTRTTKPDNVLTLKKALEIAEVNRFAIGSFSPRYTPMIAAVLQGAQKSGSPAIVQISHKELIRYGITPAEFADEFYERLNTDRITVPVVLHLDHTKEPGPIQEAIEAGFTSVMIDASEKSLEDNIAISREVAEYAHAKGVSVEAELGMIGTTDFVETDKDEELYTDPEEAAYFVRQTGVDALAVSCGTAHGVYMVKQPKVDYERLRAIRTLTPVHLVLHGGSGVPADMVQKAVKLPDGGVSKVNIATDLELALLDALNRKERMTNKECLRLSPAQLALGREAVAETVVEKIRHVLNSEGQGHHF